MARQRDMGLGQQARQRRRAKLYERAVEQCVIDVSEEWHVYGVTTRTGVKEPTALLVVVLVVYHFVEQRHPCLEPRDRRLSDRVDDILNLLWRETPGVQRQRGSLRHGAADLLAGVVFHLQAALVEIAVHPSPPLSSALPVA